MKEENLRYNTRVNPEDGMLNDSYDLSNLQTGQGHYFDVKEGTKTVPWCKYFVPKIAAPGIAPDDPELNEKIRYAKCIRGHVLRDANGWLLCENLPTPDSQCWQEGGQTLLTPGVRQRNNLESAPEPANSPQAARS